MERRSFLAAVAAAPAGLLSHVSAEPVDAVTPCDQGSVGTPAAEPKPPTYFYTRSIEFDDGKRHPVGVYGSHANAEGGSLTKSAVRRKTFKPQAGPRRFRVCSQAWMPTFPEYDIRDKASEAAARAQWHEACFAQPLPASFVEPLEGIAYYSEFVATEGELFDRAGGLAAVANRNRDVFNADDPIGMEWSVLIELGEPLPLPFCILSMEANGVGSETRESYYPVRLVRPTAAELTQYAISADNS